MKSNEEILAKAQTYGIQQIPSEFFKVLDHISVFNGAKGIDIGCYTGGSTLALSFKCSKLASIDLNKSFDTSEIALNCQHKFFEGDSKNPELIVAVENYFEGELVDFMFIDGDHTLNGAYQDYQNYKHIVRHGGFIFFHDIVDSSFHRQHNCYVSHDWQKIKQLHTYEEFIDSPDQIWAGIGMIVV